jgi:hypothetical protein
METVLCSIAITSTLERVIAQNSRLVSPNRDADADADTDCSSRRNSISFSSTSSVSENKGAFTLVSYNNKRTMATDPFLDTSQLKTSMTPCFKTKKLRTTTETDFENSTSSSSSTWSSSSSSSSDQDDSKRPDSRAFSSLDDLSDMSKLTPSVAGWNPIKLAVDIE